MSFLSRAFTGKSEARAVAKLPYDIPKWSEVSGNSGYAGDGDAMTLSTFYACVTLLADIVASLPVKAYRPDGEIRKPLRPQPKLLQPSPYPGLTWFEWSFSLMEAMAITGNGFGYITARDSTGRPTAIMPVHPDSVQIDKSEETGWLDPVYRFGGKVVDTADVMHIKRYPIAGKPWGMSPVEKAMSSINLGLSAEQYGIRWFRDSAQPSGILSTEQELVTAQIQQILKQWTLAHRNRRAPAVLPGGMKWQTVGIPANESQFLETRQWQVAEIARWFRIPLHMIQEHEKSTSYGTGIEHQSIGFVTYTLAPWLKCIEEALSIYLPGQQFIKFNIDGLLRGDFKTRWEGHQIAIQCGAASINEVRAREDWPPIPNGDIHLQPLNFGELGKPPKEAQPNSPSPDASGEIGDNQ